MKYTVFSNFTNKNIQQLITCNMKKRITQFIAALCLLAAPATSSLAQVTANPYRADVNKDGEVNIGDVSRIITVMANGNTRIKDLSPEGAEAVDMGFPSGTKWANMNVGANSPEDYGLFFAWAETTGYEGDASDGRVFGWEQYKWMSEGGSSWEQINKYQISDGRIAACWYDDEGKYTGDSKVVLGMEDDAALTHWGVKWRTPTYAELEELKDFSNASWTKKNGVDGLQLTSKINGNSIFLPAAGYRTDSSVEDKGGSGNYWASTLRSTDTIVAGCLIVSSAGASMSYTERLGGRSIRPVLQK